MVNLLHLGEPFMHQEILSGKVSLGNQVGRTMRPNCVSRSSLLAAVHCFAVGDQPFIQNVHLPALSKSLNSNGILTPIVDVDGGKDGLWDLDVAAAQCNARENPKPAPIRNLPRLGWCADPEAFST